MIQDVFIRDTMTSVERLIPDVSRSVQRVIVAQFCLESGFGLSRLARECHNLCGMRTPKMRPHLGVDDGGFLHFETVDDCILDYKMWLDYHKRDLSETTVDEYLACLKAWKYCPDRLYLDRVRACLSKVDSVLS